MSPNLRGANKVKALFEKSAEAYVETILSAICGDSDRVYDERSVKRALGRNRVKIADAAIDYGTSWVVVETTTSQITRESVGGTSEESLSRDINKLVDNKVVQLSSTVDELRERGQMLCGYESTTPRRFYPILAMADGFPVNPVTVTAIRERATRKGLLTGADVAALEILDLVELEMIEGATEVSGLTMPQILEGKSRSELWRDSVQHYILSELELSPPVPERVRAGFQQILEILVEPLRPDR